MTLDTPFVSVGRFPSLPSANMEGCEFPVRLDNESALLACTREQCRTERSSIA